MKKKLFFQNQFSQKNSKKIVRTGKIIFVIEKIFFHTGNIFKKLKNY